MDTKPERPKPVAAWGITWAAILDLIAFGFMIASRADLLLLWIFGACEALLIFYSVKAWKDYFECYTRYEIKRAMANKSCEATGDNVPG